jgi:hypothetical protein
MSGFLDDGQEVPSEVPIHGLHVMFDIKFDGCFWILHGLDIADLNDLDVEAAYSLRLQRKVCTKYGLVFATLVKRDHFIFPSRLFPALEI